MKWLVTFALKRGLLSGSRFFTSVGLIAMGMRLLARLAGVGPKTLYTHKLKAREVLVISDQSPRE